MSLKTELLNIKQSRFLYSKENCGILDIIKATGQQYYIRTTGQTTSIVVGNKEFIYPKKGNAFSRSAMYLFASVKKDAVQFIGNNPNWVCPDKLPVNKINYDYDDSRGKITGTDINHAYWTVAKDVGIISHKTYLNGLKVKFFAITPEGKHVFADHDEQQVMDFIQQESGKSFKAALKAKWSIRREESKATRLAALAVLGRKKTYKKFKGDKLIEIVTVQEEDLRLQDCYKGVRYLCYKMMNEIADLLGPEFEAYKTDCIYYRDTAANRFIVHSFLRRAGMEFKQLVY